MKLRMKEVFQKKGVSVRKMARVCGVDYLTMLNIVNNKRKQVKLELLDDVCRFLDVRAGELFDEELESQN